MAFKTFEKIAKCPISLSLLKGPNYWIYPLWQRLLKMLHYIASFEFFDERKCSMFPCVSVLYKRLYKRLISYKFANCK